VVKALRGDEKSGGPLRKGHGEINIVQKKKEEEIKGEKTARGNGI